MLDIRAVDGPLETGAHGADGHSGGIAVVHPGSRTVDLRYAPPGVAGRRIIPAADLLWRPTLPGLRGGVPRPKGRCADGQVSGGVYRNRLLLTRFGHDCLPEFHTVGCGYDAVSS